MPEPIEPNHHIWDDSKSNPLWGTQREVALSENIIDQIYSETQTVLDAGCGDGFLLYQLHLQNSKLSLHGVELSENRMNTLKDKITSSQFSLANVTKLPFTDQFFDTVICSEVLEHLEFPELALRELWRVTRRQLIITVPNDQALVRHLCPHCNQPFMQAGHLHQIDQKLLSQWITPLNCSSTHFKTFHTIYSYNKMTLKWPSFLRKIFDFLLVKSHLLIPFTKPNYLLASIER